MANIRPKDTDALSTLASNHEILVDGPDGFGTFLRDTFISQVAALIVANPTTYKIATLDGADKLTSSQDPSQPLSYKGTHNASTNSPALADGSGTAGDTYQVNVAGTRNYGSGSLTLAVGDALVYNGSIWQQVSGVANILDGISTPAAAQTALEVISEDESAEIAGTKLVGPALYFDGSNDYLEVADDAKLSFTDGTDDLPFSISAWVKMGDATNFTIASKYSSSNEWRFYVNGTDDLSLAVTDGTNSAFVVSDTALTSREGEWLHVAVAYAGSGPNSGNAFTSAADGITLYVNGVAVAITATNNGSYAGMSDTSDPVWIGRHAAVYSKGHIKDVKLFNRELTATEVAQLARGADLGFADEWAGALGGVFTQDSTPSGEWTAVNATDADEAGPIGGKSNVLKITSDNTNNAHYVSVPTGASGGKRYRIEFLYRIPSGQSNVDGIVVDVSAAFGVYTAVAPATDTWLKASFEYVNPGSTMNVFMTDGGNKTFTDSGGDDLLYIAECKITEIGKLADFRAEDFNESAGKLLDRSSNNFVGVNTGATLVGKRRHISAATLDLTNLPTSSAGLSAGEVWSNSGVLTIVT